MPPVNRHPRHHLFETIHDSTAGVGALAKQQQTVVSIPVVLGVPVASGGDPAHGYATFVTGWLGDICGINKYGAASFKTGSWVQL